MNEEVGLKLAIDNSAYICHLGPLVVAENHRASSTEVYKLHKEAVLRLHRIWYLHRKTPDIKRRFNLH